MAAPSAQLSRSVRFQALSAHRPCAPAASMGVRAAAMASSALRAATPSRWAARRTVSAARSAPETPIAAEAVSASTFSEPIRASSA